MKSKKEIKKLLGVSDSTATRILKKLVVNNFLESNGNGRSTSYTFINKNKDSQ